MFRLLQNLGLILASTILALLVFELGSRLIDGRPVLATTNWVAAELERNTETDTARFDPEMGWHPRENLRLKGFTKFRADQPDLDHVLTTTDSLGLRMNDQSLRPAPRGAILAIGDSFTWGSEVSDHETYPAHLEKILGEPVLNGGYGGWGLGQMYLRARELVPKLTPRLLLLTPLSNDALRTAYRRSGRAFKPYFIIEDGGLVLQQTPVPRTSSKARDVGAIQSVLGYSYGIMWASKLLGYQEVWVNRNKLNDKVHSFEEAVRISCLLLDEFIDLGQLHGFELLFGVLYGAGEVKQGKRHWFSSELLKCARERGLRVVDTFQQFVREIDIDENRVFELYNRWPDGRLGHMTPEGNRLVAKILSGHVQNLTEDLTQGSGLSSSAP